MRDSLKWEERVLASRESGKDPKLPEEGHLVGHRRKIGQHHILLHRGQERMTQQLIFL